MPVREFVDTQGRRWTVWNTVPDWLNGVSAAFNTGWLTFECGSERRRLAPIPADWENAALGTLQGYCKRAEPVRSDRRSREIDADSRW